ncbi:cysteine proteinase [Byssothecium circinans]|uniref:ubiquitinyl hydrolase 1 n=1 Tax=Byssothecium circinans TaxID=147558 RepID=A0A6A5U9G3_9PLEO|nr:cysteine proteinase [Byssothecium circinans]
MAGEKIGMLRLVGATSSAEESPEDGAQTTVMQRGGNVLGTLFGLKGANLLQKGVRGIRSLSMSTGSSETPPGLGNFDNSCFQNSVIQGLAALPSLREYLSKTVAQNTSLDTDTTNGALSDIIRQLSNPNHSGGHFWIRGKLKNMSTFQQQDAQEYYSKILDALDKEVQTASNSMRRFSSSWSEVAKSLGGVGTTTSDEKVAPEEQVSEQPTIMPNPLDGLLAQRVGCINCGYTEGLQLIPFNCLTVSLGGSSMYDIRDCLDEYTTLEHIEGVECAKCTLLRYRDTIAGLAAKSEMYASKLQAIEEALEDDDFDDKTIVKKFNILKKNWTTTTKSKQAVIARAPKALVMHVNRSIFDEWSGYQRKNEAHVSYPAILDLGNWCLGKRPSETNAPDNATEEWPRDPKKSMLGDASAEVSDSPFQYRLRAAVTHSGTHGSGHYVCFRPHPKKPTLHEDEDGEIEEQGVGEQWWRFSDESVWPVAEEQAHQGNVFMLFYERIDEPLSMVRDDTITSLIAHPMAEDLPLPPSDIVSAANTIDTTAVDIPLPEDSDDEFSLPELASANTPTPPLSIAEPTTPIAHSPTPPHEPTELSTSAYPTPPPETPPTEQPSATPSEADSDGTQDTHSTTMTSEDEATVTFDASQLKLSPRLHLMRTAGDSPARGRGNRTSLPMVTAT